MQSAAVPCTSNGGLKRTAANAFASTTDSATDSPSSSSSSTAFTTLASSSPNHNAPPMSSTSPPPPEKRSFIVIESPLKLGTIASAEDLDIKVLRIQNKNLSESLLKRQKLEADLRAKIDSLQNRKAADDNKLCIFDRYWTQLDEDLRLMLERFQANCRAELTNSSTSTSTSNESNSNDADSNEASTTTSTATTTTTTTTTKLSSSVRTFLNKINDWDKVEMEDKLKERVKFTTESISKLMEHYDRQSKRYENYFKGIVDVKMMDTDSQDDAAATTVAKLKQRNQELIDENHRLAKVITQCQTNAHLTGLDFKTLEDRVANLENEIKELNNRNDETEYELEKTRDKAFRLDRQLADTMTKLTNLQKANIITNSNSNHNHVDQNGHNNNNNNNINNNSNNSNQRNDKLQNLTDKQISDLETDLEDQRELASSRLQELEKLNLEYQGALRNIEKLKADLKTIPESVIEQTTEYKNLQTKYSIIVSDNIKLKQALDETRNLLESSRIQFQRQLEQMESDELAQQKKLGNQVMQLEEQLCQLKKEYDLIRIEYEQNIAANEQTGPINKEMRSLITTLQTNNKLLKSENVRSKKRHDEMQSELDRIKKHNAQLQSQLQQQQHQLAHIKKENASSSSTSTSTSTSTTNDTNHSSTTTTTTDTTANIKSEVKSEPTSGEQNENKSAILDTLVKKDEQLNQKDLEIRELKEQIRKLHDNQKDYKSILEKQATNSVDVKSPPATNSNMSSNSSHSKSRNIELEEAKSEIKRLNCVIDKLKAAAAASSSKSLLSPSLTTTTTTSASHSSHSHHSTPTPTPTPTIQPKSEDEKPSTSLNQTVSSSSSSSSSTPANTHSSSSSSSSSSSVLNDYIKKIKSLEENVRELHKMLNNKKQEEAALLNDMEITGQAFEDMQEQNIRLMQQLREKDDANFKLVSERIKLENVQKILKEEKETFAQQIITLQEQHDNQLNVVKKLEEQIQFLTQSVAIYEKEIHQLHQACENYKRQAIDNVQIIQDLKLNTQKYLCQLKEAQQQIAEKTESLAAQSFSSKRAQEEIKHLQSKLERQKKFEMASNMDEVLKEELKEYKEQLRCPSCKVKDKDAVLTKCFHVFCFDCLQKRYDTRQRKCPKCNANFGANDFRKLYLS